VSDGFRAIGCHAVSNVGGSMNALRHANYLRAFGRFFHAWKGTQTMAKDPWKKSADEYGNRPDESWASNMKKFRDPVNGKVLQQNPLTRLDRGASSPTSKRAVNEWAVEPLASSSKPVPDGPCPAIDPRQSARENEPPDCRTPR